MAAIGVIPGYINPLIIPLLDDQFFPQLSQGPEADALTLIAQALGSNGNALDTARRRYKELQNLRADPPFLPAHDVVVRHIMRPLKEAKQCYVLGMPVACIAQAGFVGEMVALWRFRMLELQLNDRPLNNDLQELLRGRPFEKLGQVERVRVLRTVDNLDQETFDAFGQLRSIRKQYLHYMVEPTRDTDGDARRAYRWACVLVTNTLDLRVVNGKMIFRTRVTRFIQELVTLTDAPA